MAERRRPLLPWLAAAGLAFAAWAVFSPQRTVPPPPATPPPKAPYPETLAGAGIVEPAQGRTTAIGAPFAALVLEVRVEVGDVVAADAPLLRLDDRVLAAAEGPLTQAVASAEASARAAAEEAAARAAEVEVAQAGERAAQARQDRVERAPRPESLPPLRARVAEAETAVGDLRAQVARLEEVRQRSPGTVTTDDWDRRRHALEAAEAALVRARADLGLAEAGAWEPERAEARAATAEAAGRLALARAAHEKAQALVAVAEAEAARARAALAQNALERARAVVRAPRAGTVLDVAVRAGEHAAAGRDPLLVLGDVTRLTVRVDVDEESAPRVRAGCRAQAVVRGFPQHPLELVFLRLEPYVKPKRSLTGATTERVDTRVLQVLFAVEAPPEGLPLPLYVGQQVDVFLEGAARPPAAPAPPQGGAAR